jgi:Cold shock proteins
VFVSYSHDSPDHERRALELANRLRVDGLNAIIDQHHTAPPEGLPRWMESQIQDADFVLLICTGSYLRRVERHERPGKGRGVMWEANLIYNLLYHGDSEVQKFIPVLFEGGSIAFVPLPLRGLTHYFVDTPAGYDSLYRHLTGQPAHVAPEVGHLRVLPAAGQHRPTDHSLPPHLLRPRSQYFVGRSSELRDIHSQLNRRVSVGVPRQICIHGMAGSGKTSMAIEYAWRHIDAYPGGLFFIDCSGDYKNQLVSLSTRLPNTAAPDDDDRTVQLIAQHLAAAQPSLLILDNVRDEAQWTSDKFAPLFPAGACRRLVTTRARHLTDLPTVLAGRVPLTHAVKLLSKRRRDAAHETNLAAVEEIVSRVDGWAVALAAIGIYMARVPHLSWDKYAAALTSKSVRTLIDTENSVGRLPDYQQQFDAILADMIAALSPLELRLVQYAALLPQDHVFLSWLNALVRRHFDTAGRAGPGIDDPAAAAIVDLQSEQLLVQQGDELGTLSLHRVLRQSVLARLKADGDLFPSLRQQIIELAGVDGHMLGKRIGQVKWFNRNKGFGFLADRDGDTFVHISAVERAGYTDLGEGEWVFHELAKVSGKTFAADLVKLLSEESI